VDRIAPSPVTEGLDSAMTPLGGVQGVRSEEVLGPLAGLAVGMTEIRVPRDNEYAMVVQPAHAADGRVMERAGGTYFSLLIQTF